MRLDESGNIQKNEETGRWAMLSTIFEGQQYLDFQTLLEFSGEKRSTLARKIKLLNEAMEVPFFVYKNRHYYRLDWAVKIHHWFKEYKL
jgi:hypothetical protein